MMNSAFEMMKSNPEMLKNMSKMMGDSNPAMAKMMGDSNPEDLQKMINVM